MSLWDKRNWTPMLLGQVNKPFNNSNYLYEIKLDGMRAIIYASPKEVIIKSRNNIDVTLHYPELQRIKDNVSKRVIFDGEIVILEDGKISFSALQERMHLKNNYSIDKLSKSNPVTFIVFDILYEDKDLINIPLIDRKNILNKYIDTSYFIKNKVIDTKGIELFKVIKKLNLEGIVAKEKDSIYEVSRRSNSWLKIKNFQEGIFLIGGYRVNKGSYGVTLVLGEYVNKDLLYVGKVIVGIKSSIYRDVLEIKKISKSPFRDYSSHNVIYIKPLLSCKVYYTEKTKSNHLRHPFLP